MTNAIGRGLELSSFPRRTIHLDFHTGPQVPDVGSKFDAIRFADTFERANVDSVTLFAKCHHGHLYYDTDRPERHPGLAPNLDLLERQVEALQARGIRTPIYLSVQVDEYAANKHPEWVAQVLKETVRWSSGPFQAGWHVLDMASPYQDYLADQIDEVIARFAPLDGLFLDMCWDQTSTSPWAIAAMEKANLDPELPESWDIHARQIAHEYMARYERQVTPHLKADIDSGIWFNSRPKTNLAEEASYVKHIEIEALPSGGWGYSYFPYVSRFVGPLGKPTLSHTGRFYKSWGDNGGLKSHAALAYESAQILARGMTVGVGDLLAPSGELDQDTYALIGSVYGEVKAAEPFVVGATPLAEVAVVIDPALGDAPGAAGFGIVRALQQLKVQFDLVPPGHDLEPYSLAIIPEMATIDEALANQLRQRAADGGATLVSRGASRGWDGAELLGLDGLELGEASPFSHTFMRVRADLPGASTLDHVLYERTLRLRAEGSSDALVQIVEPYFERTWRHFSGHEYTPAKPEASEWVAAAKVGSTVLLAAPFFEMFGEHGAPAYRQALGGIIGLLLPEPLVRADGPTHLETSVVDVNETRVVHLVSYLATRVADGTPLVYLPPSGLDVVEDPFPLVERTISVKWDRRPEQVTLEPAGQVLEYEWDGTYAHVRVTMLDGHGLLVLR